MTYQPIPAATSPHDEHDAWYEEAEVKKVCRELLATLQREKLVLDWREKQQAKAGVMQTLKVEMRRLPAQYTKDIRSDKMARAYAHVYDH